jgi:hypothetical protein
MRQRLVGENGKTRPLGGNRERFPYALIWPGPIEEMAIVDFEKLRQRIRGFRIECRSGKRALHQNTGTLANHPDDLIVAQRLTAKRRHQLVCRRGDIMRRIDQRSIEIENDEHFQRGGGAALESNEPP